MNHVQGENGKSFFQNKIVSRIIATVLAVAIMAIAILMIRTVTRKPENLENQNMEMANMITPSPEPEEAVAEGESEDAEEAIAPLSAEDIALNQSVKAGLKKTGLSLESKYAVVMSGDGTILYGENQNTKMYPASMTKLMTALLVVENVSDLSEKLTVSQETMNYTYDEDGSNAGFAVGEKASALDMLYGVLLPSGADASVTLAEYVGGSHEGFVEMMNEKAKELGMTKTHFTNCVGFYNKDHYSTTKDIAILLQECLKNDLLKEIMSQSSHKVEKTNKHKQGFTFYSTVFKKVKKINLDGITFLGGKTGYTSQAGQCLATAAIINDKEYILVTGASRTAPDGIAGSAVDAQTVYQKIKKLTK